MALVDELEKLSALHDAGKLSDEEFVAAKGRLLGAAQDDGAIPEGHSAAHINALRRSRSDRWLGGVCGGIARLSGVDAWIWRLLWSLSVFFAGVGLLAYLLCWIFVPEEDFAG